jgi:tetratricopeptide (TPR) repeat protein
MKENDKAFEYYSKALELDPNYFDSNYSIGFIHYNRGRAVIDQMNQLGMSTADQKKYDQLKKVKEEHFKTSLPYFEKCHELKPTDELSIKALWEVYRQIGQPEKSLKMKELLDEMGSL